MLFLIVGIKTQASSSKKTAGTTFSNMFILILSTLFQMIILHEEAWRQASRCQSELCQSIFRGSSVKEE